MTGRPPNREDRPPSGAVLAVDRVTAAILAMRHLDMGTIVGCYERSGDDYETNVPELVLRDEFGAPNLHARGDGTFATVHSYATGGDVSLHGPGTLQGGALDDPLVMVHDVNLSETVAEAAAGRTLAEVVDVARRPVLAALAKAVVTRVVNGDTRPSGGRAYVHIHLDPAWRTMRIPDYNA